MHRHTWDDLPTTVRTAISQRCGQIATATPATAGRNAHFTATLQPTAGDLVFCKAVQAHPDTARAHRRERHATQAMPPTRAPRLLWDLEVDGWLILGLQHIPGRHPDLSPSSPDLPVLADTLSTLARDLTPTPAPIPDLAAKWARLPAWRAMHDHPPASLDSWTRTHLAQFAAHEPTAANAIAGDTLAHTDVHEHNILITNHTRNTDEGSGISSDGSTAYLVDWAWAHRTAPWVDTAHLVIRLIQAGHTPTTAEQWAATTTPWHTATPTALTTFAIQTYGLWEHLRHTDPRPTRETPTAAARTWAQHRTTTQ